MDHEASYIMTRVTVVAEVAHRGQVGIRASVVSHINMSSHGGDGWGRDDLYCPPHRGCGGGSQQGDSCRRSWKEAKKWAFLPGIGGRVEVALDTVA